MQQKDQILKQEHQKTIWTNYAIVLIGFWLLTGHAAFGYASTLFACNDMICGALLVILGFVSVPYRNTFAPWLICIIGIWLQFAPLVLWAPHSSIYVNDTLIGALVFAFSILVPGMPGQLPEEGPSVPRGWSYNPSSYAQRMPIILLGCIGWFISRYLEAYQLGFIDTVWDPFFKNGTLDVITSKVSRAFPVSDAGLGAFAYTMEVLLAMKGGERRWRTMPWISLLFGLLVVPLGLTSIVLITLQPIAVGAWCSLCLFTAFCMMIMIALAVDELVAVIQFLRSKRSAKKSFWLVFFKGDQDGYASYDVRTPSIDSPIYRLFPAMVWGVSMPWNLIVSALLGVSLMVFPSFFGVDGRLADVDHVLGALTVVVSVISMGEVVRRMRYINIFFGSILILATLIFDLYFPKLPLFIHLLVGALIIVLSFRKGPIYETYGK